MPQKIKDDKKTKFHKFLSAKACCDVNCNAENIDSGRIHVIRMYIKQPIIILPFFRGKLTIEDEAKAKNGYLR